MYHGFDETNIRLQILKNIFIIKNEVLICKSKDFESNLKKKKKENFATIDDGFLSFYEKPGLF